MKKIIGYFIVAIVTTVLTLSYSSEADRGGLSSIISNKQNNDQYQLFKKIVEITKKNYVEEVEDEKLFYSAFDGMLSSLDPHSAFLGPEDFKEINIQTKGEFGGVGIEITMDKGLIKVVSPLDDTPAFKAGMKPLDYITMIDGESVRDLTINQAVQKIRGPRGTEVKLTVIREGAPDPIDFILKRSTIKIASVKSEILQDDVAYVRVSSFSQKTTENIESHLKKLKSKMGKDISGVILDLRNNPGGLLEEAVGVSSLFLDGGVVVSTKGRNRNSTEIFNASGGDVGDSLSMVVLINQGSASASEIVAGALQDHKRALVVGTKSFGKGSVQTVVTLADDIGMRLTTSRYYTPNGRSIQAEGIMPDIEVSQTKFKINNEKEKEYVSEANLAGHLENGKSKLKGKKKDEVETMDDLYVRDYQLARAVDLIHAMSLFKK